MQPRPRRVLLVEDDEIDVLLTLRTFERAQSPVEFVHASNGEQALALLRGEPPYASLAPFDAMVLDLQMPVMDGFETLAHVRGDAELRDFPVIILTTSVADEDVIRSRHLAADAYIRKPLGVNEFLYTLEELVSKRLGSQERQPAPAVLHA